MPYSSVEDIPDSVKDRIKSPKKRRQWMHVFNSTFDQTKDEGRAFAAANGVVKKGAEAESFGFFMPICKVDKERRTVSGYASTEALDFDGERVAKAAIKAALPNYWQFRNIREMHQPSAVGVAKEANIDEKGLFLTAKIVDDNAWKKVEEGVYKGFSVGGKKLAKSGNTITKIDLVEISIVDRPANPECRFTVQKSAKVDGAEAYLIPAPPDDTDPTVRAVFKKMAEVFESLPSAPALDSDAAAAKQLRKQEKRDKKEQKRLAKQAQSSEDSAEKSPESASLPPFLTLDADGGAEAALGKIGSSHVLDLEADGNVFRLQEGGADNDLKKRMSTAGSLSYTFDALRGAQRSLLLEAKQEGGDRRDKQLASELGAISRDLARIISRKAEHEGEEAVDFTDADDVNFLSIYGDEVSKMTTTENKQPDALSLWLQKQITAAATKAVGSQGAPTNPNPAESPRAMLKSVRAALREAASTQSEAADCVKGLFDLHRTAYLAQAKIGKAGKKDDDDLPFDHEKAMKVLKTVFATLNQQGEAIKAMRATLKKAASRVKGDGVVEQPVDGVYRVPDGVTTISPGEMDNLRAAKGAGATTNGEMMTKREAEALAKAAAAEARVEVLSKIPAGPVYGQRPYNFDLNKVGAANNGDPSPVAEFFKGANPANLTSVDQNTREAEVAKAIGNNILGGKGKSLFDPNFHGVGGIGQGGGAA